MIRDDDSEADAAATTYLYMCLNGRANRLRRHMDTRSHREPLTLSEDDYARGGAERVQNAADVRWESGYKGVADRMALEQAAHRLTPRELKLILDLFWSQKTIAELCAERHVSKNSVLKMRRNALQKLRKALIRMERT